MSVPPSPLRKVEYRSWLPSALRRETNPFPPLDVRSKAPGVVGKLADCVVPATTTLPLGSTTTSRTMSVPVLLAPPRYVPKTTELPDASNLITKPS
jgi:hypothetical protein